MTRQNAKPSAPKKQRKSYSGKQKCHTIKDQLIINGSTGEVICVGEGKGSLHDFELFRQSKIQIADDILVVGDTGYQGLATLHINSLAPIKKPRNGVLTPLQKLFNSNLSKYRMRVEHVNRRIKRFKILQSATETINVSICCEFHLFVAFITMNRGFRTGLLYHGFSRVITHLSKIDYSTAPFSDFLTPRSTMPCSLTK